MINCSGCKHWRPVWNGADFDWDPDSKHIPDEDRKEWGWCEKITMPDTFEKVVEGTKAFTMDGSEYRATLHTRSDFGCVLGEEGS